MNCLIVFITLPGIYYQISCSSFEVLTSWILVFRFHCCGHLNLTNAGSQCASCSPGSSIYGLNITIVSKLVTALSFLLWPKVAFGSS